VALNALLGIVVPLFLSVPFVMAFRIDRQVATFQREAFGHLARAARNLRIMGWSIFVYYLGVLGGSWWIGDLRASVQWPMPASGLQVLLRVGAAVLGYAFAGAVAHELYKVTEPRFPGA